MSLAQLVAPPLPDIESYWEEWLVTLIRNSEGSTRRFLVCAYHYASSILGFSKGWKRETCRQLGTTGGRITDIARMYTDEGEGWGVSEEIAERAHAILQEKVPTAFTDTGVLREDFIRAHELRDSPETNREALIRAVIDLNNDDLVDLFYVLKCTRGDFFRSLKSKGFAS